jgi:hypothetical protein
MKLLRQNIADNLSLVFPGLKKPGNSKRRQAEGLGEHIKTAVLDWEEDDVSQLQPVDVVVACDCIYNEALVEPFNSTCAAICRLNDSKERPTLCIIAQQLRAPDVLEAWMKSFHQKFHTWQVPDRFLDEGLRENSGFVVHIGIVR